MTFPRFVSRFCLVGLCLVCNSCGLLKLPGAISRTASDIVRMPLSVAGAAARAAPSIAP